MHRPALSGYAKMAEEERKYAYDNKQEQEIRTGKQGEHAVISAENNEQIEADAHQYRQFLAWQSESEDKDSDNNDYENGGDDEKHHDVIYDVAAERRAGVNIHFQDIAENELAYVIDAGSKRDAGQERQKRKNKLFHSLLYCGEK